MLEKSPAKYNIRIRFRFKRDITVLLFITKSTVIHVCLGLIQESNSVMCWILKILFQSSEGRKVEQRMSFLIRPVHNYTYVYSLRCLCPLLYVYEQKAVFN